MIPNRDAQPGYSRSIYKRQRTDDSSDAFDGEPPTKISKTSPGPLQHRREDSEETKVREIEAASKLERIMVEALKVKNVIALCSPRAVTRVVTNVLLWTIDESALDSPVFVLVVDDPPTMQRLRESLQRNIPAIDIRMITSMRNEKDFTSFSTANRRVIFTSAEGVSRLLSCNLFFKAQISTIIFCNHTLFEHGAGFNAIITKIMMDYGSGPAPSASPRVLVLIPTLQRDIPSESNVHQLKTILDASLVGVTDPEEFAVEFPSQNRPTELVIVYHSQENLQETLLCKKLRDCDPENLHLGSHFRNAKLALSDLGSCAADLVWRETFGPFSQSEETFPTSDTDHQSSLTEARDLVRHWPFKLPNLDTTSRNMNVSHKFIRLIQILESYEAYGDSFRGIIFVQRRLIAQLLVALFHSLMPRLQFLRPIALVNHRLSSDCASMETIYHKFASGRYNLLVATKSYEDVTLPGASVVILYDVFESQMSLAYTRRFVGIGGGHFIHMIEEESNIHRLALARTSFDAEMHRWSDAIKHNSSWLFPPRLLRESGDAYFSDSEDDQDNDFIQDPVTGDRLRKYQASTTLCRCASRLAGSDKLPGDQPFLQCDIFENAGRKEWRCIINLPGAHINISPGPSYPSLFLARREACYSACRQLQHLGELDSSVFPHHKTPKANLTDDEADVQIDPGHERPHIPLSPDFWNISISHPPFPDFLYPCIVSTAIPGSGLDERAPICILTRTPLPNLPRFKLFRSNKPIEICFNRAPPVKLDTDRLDQAHQFTIKFCRILMNKPFQSPSWQSMGYLFLPLKRNWNLSFEMGQRSSPSTLVDGVDWNTVSRVSESWAVPLIDLVHLERNLEDAVVQDRAVEFTHRCEITRIRNDMTPLSEVDDKPMGYSLLKYAAFATDERFVQGGKTLLEQCHSRRKNFEGLQEPNQPILEVVRMLGATNCLNLRIPSNNELPEKGVQLLIPEYCRKLAAPASTLRMGYLLPSITRRIYEFLLVKQLNAKVLDHCVRDDLFVIATVSPSAGNDYDYERLEILGDAFLKYLSSIYVYSQNPHGSEGELHNARQKYISNQQLCYIATRLGLPGYIQLKPFNIKSWIPPGMKVADPQKKESPVTDASDRADNATLPQHMSASSKPNDDSWTDSNQGKGPKNRKKRVKKNVHLSPIANKTVADVVEAIIGAAYISGGREAALKAAKCLTIPFTEVEEWSDFDRKGCVPQNNIDHRLDISALTIIEDTIGHTFRKRHLLALALTHTNFNTVEMKHHQRLEFIGDAVLDFLVVCYLYEKNERASPGDLSISKSMMVSNSTLAAICVWSGLHRFIHATQQLGQTIQNYEKALLAQQAAMLAGAPNESRARVQYWTDLEAPKTLSDVVESLIGAALISDGFSQRGVNDIFNKLLLPFYEKYVPPQTSHNHSSSEMLPHTGMP